MQLGSHAVAVHFRPFAGEEDIASLLHVRQGTCEHDCIDDRSAREAPPSLAGMYAIFGDVAPGSADVLIAEAGGKIVGYNHVLWRWTEEDGTWVGLHLGYVLPEWRNRGIGHEMLGWAQKRLQTLKAVEAPYANGRFATNVSSTEREAARLIKLSGYTVASTLAELVLRDFAALESQCLPRDVELRPLLASHERAIFEAYVDAWTGTGVSHTIAETSYGDFAVENFRHPRFDTRLWHVAWAGERVAGFVSGLLRNQTGIIPEVAVRKQWQRRGIARALVTMTLQELRAQGVEEVRIVTNADDPLGARSLYESLGFRSRKLFYLYRKSMEPQRAAINCPEIASNT